MSNLIAQTTSTLLLVLLAACSSTAGHSAAASPGKEPLGTTRDARADAERALLAALEKYRVPGLAAAVVHDGELVFRTSLGWADAEQRVPVRDDTLFQLASISKTVTATVVMQQVERGALDLDADIGVVLPFAIRHPVHPDVAITTRMLLTHTAAVRDDWDVLEGTWVHDRDYPLSLADSIEAYFRPGGEYYAPDECFQEWAPGTRHEYANIGFALLAYVAQCAADVPFEELVRTGVLEPLGIEGGFRLAEVDVTRVAQPHEFIDGANSFETLGHHAYLDFASGTLRLSASGLARLLQAYQRGGELDGARILDDATVQEMLRVQFQSIDDEQGLAWYRTDALPGDWWGHDGSDPGVATQMLWRRSDGVGIVLLLDAEPSDWDGETEMLEILLGVLDRATESDTLESRALDARTIRSFAAADAMQLNYATCVHDQVDASAADATSVGVAQLHAHCQRRNP